LPAVLLIEDDPNLGAMTCEMLDPEYRMGWARSIEEATAMLRGR
jgi:DNA-binding response OmpR family regulator